MMNIKSVLNTDVEWKKIFNDKNLTTELLSGIIPKYLQTCRWFGGKASTIKKVMIEDSLVLSYKNTCAYLLLLEVLFEEGFVHQYLLPFGFKPKKKGKKEIEDKAIIAPIKIQDNAGWLVDALYLEDFRNYLFYQIINKKRNKFKQGKLTFDRGRILAKEAKKNEITVSSEILKADQSNTSIIYNDKYFLKIFRRLFRDPNPDLEMVHFLSEKAKFKNTPRYAGSITWKKEGMYDISLGLMQEKIDNEGDAWNWLLKHIQSFFKKLEKREVKVKSIEKIPLFKPLKINNLSKDLVDYIGEEVLIGVEKLAKRTAQMHICLSREMVSTKFNPVYYNGDYVVWLKNRLMYQFDARYNLVQKNINKLSGLALEYAQEFIRQKPNIINHILTFNETNLTSRRVRVHGDYHLGQILVRDNDFFILDFEGEPESTIRDRKVKQSPLKDVAGIFRSFHYAVYATIFNEHQNWRYSRDELFDAGEKYYRCLVSIFLHKYLKMSFQHQLDIGYFPEIIYLLKYNLLEKAIYELGYELQGRPSWAIIPLQGIMQLINDDGKIYS